MSDLFRTLIVPASQVDLARAIAASFGPGGQGMWTTPLSASGLNPATHYISTGYISAEFVSLAPMATWEQNEDGNWVQTNYYSGDAAAVYGMCQQAGLSYTFAEIENVFIRSDVSQQEPFTALDRMGLKIINPSESI